MSRSLADFRLGMDVSERLQAPAYWLLRGLYESAVAIAVHLQVDGARTFEADSAKESLLKWLGRLETAARHTGTVRPVVACLEAESKALRDEMSGWENDAHWRGAGYVLFPETNDEVADRLEKVLFKTVREVEIRDSDIESSAAEILRRLAETAQNEHSRNLMGALSDLVKRGRNGDLKKAVQELLAAWDNELPEKPPAPKRDPREVVQDHNAPDAFPERDRVARLRSIEIQNFRGWVGTHTLDTDADLVLLAGPNGYGKSSLLQAMTLALTGSPVFRFVNLRSNTLSTNVEPILSMRCSVRDGDSYSLVLDFKRDTWGSQPSQVPENNPHGHIPRGNLWQDLVHSGLSPVDASDAEGHLYAVFGDQLYKRFGEDFTRDRLLSAFSRVALQISMITEELEGAIRHEHEKIEQKKASVRRRTDLSREAGVQETLRAAFRSAQPEIAELGDLYAHFAEVPLALQLWDPSEPAGDDVIEAAMRRIGDSLALDARDPGDALSRTLSDWRKKEERDAERRFDDELLGLRERCQSLQNQFPRAQQLARAFADLDRSVTLDDCVLSLNRNLKRWRDAAGLFGLTEIKEQLDRVVPVDLQRLAHAAEQQISDPRRAALEIKRLTDQIEVRSRALASTERMVRIDTLIESNKSGTMRALWDAIVAREAFRQEKAGVAALEREIDRNKKFHDALQDAANQIGRRPKEAVWQDVRELANDVLGRIQIAPGVLPVRFGGERGVDSADVAQVGRQDDRAEHDGRILTDDGRRLGELSTGQKTQIAVALSVGVNLALGRRSGVALLWLDDVSAAYDASNIAREAALWRMVAYGDLARQDRGEGLPDGQRRQVFLSSHNETTTRQLVDLLRPPQGATMKLIRLLDWNPDRGPRWRVEEIRPAQPSSLRSRERLARELLHVFGRNR